ncbi:MAG: RES family NAD+ phosphorylase [Vicinamibacterales bacterium]
MSVPQALVRWKSASRLIPSRFPSTGLFDRVAHPADLEALFELEDWTNDRISAEVGLLQRIPKDEWVVGAPMASVVMAAYCHPRAGGARFSDAERGAWYAARTLETAMAETIYHRTREIAEVGGYDTRVQMRLYLSDLSARFHDVRSIRATAALYRPDSYSESQRVGKELLDAGSNGIVYRSVRHPAGECIACFRPALVKNVRVGGHYELRWEGRPEPAVKKM